VQLFERWYPILSPVRQQNKKGDVTSGSTGSPINPAPGEPRRSVEKKGE